MGAVAAEDADGLSRASLQLSGLDDVDCLMLISKPEPSWLTADWRRRILAARYVPLQETGKSLHSMYLRVLFWCKLL